MMPTNIYIIEDHLVLQHMLNDFINVLPGLTVCGVTSAGREALTQIPKIKPDLILVDLSLPDINGIEIVDKLHAWCPTLLMLILSSYREAFYAERALSVGACGYIVKGDPLEIGIAIRQALSGEIYLSPHIRDE